MINNQPQQQAEKFSGLAWTALILGVIGVVGSPVILFNNLTGIVAGVGAVLAVIALFGTRKLLAASGLVLCVAAVVFTVLAQQAAVREFDRDMDKLRSDIDAISNTTGGTGDCRDPYTIRDLGDLLDSIVAPRS